MEKLCDRLLLVNALSLELLNHKPVDADHFGEKEYLPFKPIQYPFGDDSDFQTWEVYVPLPSTTGSMTYLYQYLIAKEISLK